MSRKYKSAVIGSFLLTPFAAAAANGVRFESDAGDYIGGGQTQTFTSVTMSGSASQLTASFGNYSATFQAPRGTSISTGTNFGGATRHPFNSPTQPGLDVSGDGRGCNRLSGWFEVREALFSSNGQIGRLAIDFKQHCENGTSALYGALRFNSDVPLEIPPRAAIVGKAQNVFGKDVVLLDAGQSFSRGAAPTFRWTQISGTPVVLRGTQQSLADFTAPLVPPGGEDLKFRLDIAADGGTDSDVATVHVNSKSDPQTYFQFNSESGDYIGAGRQFQLDRSDGDIALRTNNRGGASFSFNGGDYYSLDFGPASGVPFVVGAYEGAQRYAFADSNRPGLDVSGAGRGCNQITGRFDVLGILKGSDGLIARLALDYEQHCEGGSAALRGKVRWNHVEPGQPTAAAGADQTQSAGSNVVLDGTSSRDDKAVTVYRWRQIAGPAVSLLGADTSRASFVAPTVATPQNLDFQLLVADAEDLTAADVVRILVPATPAPVPSPAPTPSPTPTPSPAPVSNGSSAGGGGAMPALTLLAACLVVPVRRRISASHR